MHGLISRAAAVLTTAPTASPPIGVDVSNVQKIERRTLGTPFVLADYAPTAGDDRVLAVIAVSRQATDIGASIRTFGASSFAIVVDDPAGARDAVILDKSLGDGSTAPADITLSFTDTGSDNVAGVAMTLHNVAQSTAEASADSGGVSAESLNAEIDATVTGHTAGALVVSMCYRHGGDTDLFPDVHGAGVQTSLVTIMMADGAIISARIAWSEAPSTAPVTHKYVATDGGNAYGWVIAAWAPSP